MQELRERRDGRIGVDARGNDGAETVLRDLNAGQIVDMRPVPGGVEVTVRLVGVRHRAPTKACWWTDEGHVGADRRQTVSVQYDLAHDPDEQRFYLGGRPVDLAPQEYCLLRILAERPGRLLTHLQIIESVWPDGSDLDVPALQTSIYRLRGQLGPAGALVQTRRRSGYLFAADVPVGADQVVRKP